MVDELDAGGGTNATVGMTVLSLAGCDMTAAVMARINGSGRSAAKTCRRIDRTSRCSSAWMRAVAKIVGSSRATLYRVLGAKTVG